MVTKGRGLIGGVLYYYLTPYRDVLFLHFQTLEEGTRNVVAECVGKLTLVEPTTLLPLLKVGVPGKSMQIALPPVISNLSLSMATIGVATVTEMWTMNSL